MKSTQLNGLIHDKAAAGDLEAVMEMVNKDPALVTKYDIDGIVFTMNTPNGPGMINFRNIRWRTPLHWSTSYAGYEGCDRCKDISLYLASHGGDINIQNKDQMTPLEFAKRGPLGKAFAEELKKAAAGVPVRLVTLEPIVFIGVN
ncbi:unnamed protein product [Sphagnum jensenii]|uniref:Uncharacterized protein n=1 Tax=Sphagnum jensenii TaxID=128206 RepID=A0ABP0VHB1_9BRYO